MGGIDQLAPSGEEVVEYDRCNLALYAALLDAHDAGRDWREAATTVMRLDITRSDAQTCWRSHLDRARWITGEGMASAIAAFAARPAADRN